MKSLSIKIGMIAFVFLAFAGVSKAEWPWTDEKPKKACECVKGEPCICDKNCTCADGIGCKNKGVGQQGIAADTFFVGSDVTTSWPYPATVVADTTPVQTYHTEYRQVCNGSSCQMVAVTVPDQPKAKTYAAGSTCPCCGMVMTAEQAAKANTCNCATTTAVTAPTMYNTYGASACANESCGTMANGDDGSGNSSCGSGNGRNGPIRRIFSRIFRGRRSGGGCGG